jgi:hypothetical protein
VSLENLSKGSSQPTKDFIACSYFAKGVDVHANLMMIVAAQMRSVAASVSSRRVMDAKNPRSSTRSPATSASEIRPRIVFSIASASRLRRRGLYSAMRRINSDLIMKRGKHSAEPRGKCESTDASAGIASRPWRSDEARLRSANSKHPGCAQFDDAQIKDGVFMSCGEYCFVFLETYCRVYH